MTKLNVQLGMMSAYDSDLHSCSLWKRYSDIWLNVFYIFLFIFIPDIIYLMQLNCQLYFAYFVERIILGCIIMLLDPSGQVISAWWTFNEVTKVNSGLWKFIFSHTSESGNSTYGIDCYPRFQTAYCNHEKLSILRNILWNEITTA